MEEEGVRQREIKGEGRNDKIWGRIKWEETRQQREEREEKIREAKYNKWYKIVKEEQVPEYIREDRKEEKWRRIARFRMGNEMREGRYCMRVERERREVMQGMWKGKGGMGTCIRKMRERR